MKVLTINENEVLKLLPMEKAIEQIKNAMIAYAKGECFAPLRTRIEMKDGKSSVLFMQAYHRESSVVSLKVVSVFPDNPLKGKEPVPAIVFLIDGQTGEPTCMMNGTILTKIRTAAVQGLATMTLAKKECKSALLIGCGSQAPYQLQALLHARRFQKVYVYDIDVEKVERFVENESKRYPDVEITAVNDPDEVVEDVDVIVTVTTSIKPTFSGSLVKPGTLICGIGSFTPEMQEVDEEVVEKSLKIFVDTLEGTINEAGDLIIPLEKKVLNKEKIRELGEVFLGKTAGRENEEEIIFFKSVGHSIFDLFTARSVFEAAVEKELGHEIEL